MDATPFDPCWEERPFSLGDLSGWSREVEFNVGVGCIPNRAKAAAFFFNLFLFMATLAGSAALFYLDYRTSPVWNSRKRDFLLAGVSSVLVCGLMAFYLAGLSHPAMYVLYFFELNLLHLAVGLLARDWFHAFVLIEKKGLPVPKSRFFKVDLMFSMLFAVTTLGLGAFLIVGPAIVYARPRTLNYVLAFGLSFNALGSLIDAVLVVIYGRFLLRAIRPAFQIPNPDPAMVDLKKRIKVFLRAHSATVVSSAPFLLLPLWPLLTHHESLYMFYFVFFVIHPSMCLGNFCIMCFSIMRGTFYRPGTEDSDGPKSPRHSQQIQPFPSYSIQELAKPSEKTLTLTSAV